jgi:hypothetical protein
MAVTLLAINCPAVQTFGALIRRLDVYGGTASPPVGYTVPQPGNISSSPLNANAWSTDMLGRYGGGCVGIGTGLVITAGSGLQCAVSAGHAVIDSPVENPAAFTVAGLADNARNWIWMQQNATILGVPTSTTPPAMASCLLGSVLTSGGAVLQVDTSAVMYLRGMGYRETADIGVPGDIPPTSRGFFHRSLGGSSPSDYYWNGTAYLGPFQTAVAQVLNTALSSNADLTARLDDLESVVRALLRSAVDNVGLDDLLNDDILSDAYEAASDGN